MRSGGMNSDRMRKLILGGVLPALAFWEALFLAISSEMVLAILAIVFSASASFFKSAFWSGEANVSAMAVRRRLSSADG